MTGSLFDTLGDVVHERHSDWRPEAPPPLDGIHELELDCETDGLRWYRGDRPIGIGIWLPGNRGQYLPFGHRGGGNLDEGQVKEWARRELRGKHITNLNTRFDIHMLRSWGVDLEEQGCTVSDVSHYAALLDDHRKRFNLNVLSQDFLKQEKVGMELDGARMASYHAGEVAPRAIADCRLVHELKEAMWPMLTEQGLHRVRQLEDDVIFPVCEMEKNGAPCDVELLDRWIDRAQREVNKLMQELWKEAGFKISVNSNKDLARLYEKCGIDLAYIDEEHELTDAPSFKDIYLKKIQNPIIQKLRRIRKLKSLLSKYLLKYKRNVDSNGIIRYALHQLRSAKDDSQGSGEAGTVTGRFSSSAIVEDDGINIQQEMKTESQRKAFGYEEDDATHDDEIYLIRKLRIPQSESLEKGWTTKWLRADAEQIEYRIFANHADNPKITQAYVDNPRLNFHKMVHAQLRPFKEELTYRRCKDVNFCQLYGGGIKKLALMMEFITPAQFEMLTKTKAKSSHPLLREANEIRNIYLREIPEAGHITKRASKLAKERGWVATILGRRMRFPWIELPTGEKFRDRLHKAFNGVDQGTAADIAKMKLVELHKARNHTGLLMRYPVHDEVDGDARLPQTEERVRELLDRQDFPQYFKIPILWDVKTGARWSECS